MNTPLIDPGIRRSVLVLGSIALVAGAATLVLAVAEGQSLLASQGARLGTLMHLNPLGGIVTVALSAATLAAGAVGSPRLIQIAAGAWCVAAVQVIAQSGREPNVFGGTASTLAFFVALGAGLAALGFAPRPHASPEPEPAP